jgi:hypothetical protein
LASIVGLCVRTLKVSEASLLNRPNGDFSIIM